MVLRCGKCGRFMSNRENEIILEFTCTGCGTVVEKENPDYKEVE